MTESLLKKYDIPINHLDFDYIKACENVKEIEKIVLILKSGEEGYYPDLTECALTRLRSLNPNSKILREEVTVLSKQSMNREEWNNISSNINGWTENIKKQTEILCEEKKTFPEHGNSHPIRQYSDKNSNQEEEGKTKIKRIKSCDYAQWDKYNPEVEMLKMDLNEERQNEVVKMKNRKNVNDTDHIKTFEVVGKLSTIEKTDLANKHRIKGNEFYKAGDFDEAIEEYSLSIHIHPTASAFNNRAITYLKMQDWKMTISDCEECLKLEPNNIKALLRKAQALLNELKYREAYDECMKIVNINPKNVWAKNKISEIKLQIPHLPPANAFRMKIVENESDVEKETTTKIEDDFSNLIIPDKILPSKLSKLKSNFAIKPNQTSAMTKNVDDKKWQDKPQKPSNDIIIPSSQSKITEYCNGVIIEEL